MILGYHIRVHFRRVFLIITLMQELIPRTIVFDSGIIDMIIKQVPIRNARVSELPRLTWRSEAWSFNKLNLDIIIMIALGLNINVIKRVHKLADI